MRPGQQEVLLLADESGVVHSMLETDDKTADPSDWHRFKRLLREFSGIVFVVTEPVAENLVPVEFACCLSVHCPVEDVQIQAWQHHFPDFSDEEIIALVEQFPLHIQEIDLIARQSQIAARINGCGQAEKADIIAMLQRMKGKRPMPLLFGGQHR